MRRLILLIVVLLYSINVYANIELEERQKIENFTDGFLYKLLAQDFEGIELIISPNARTGLIEEIKDIFGGIQYNTLGFYPSSYEGLEGNLIKVQGSYDYNIIRGGSGSGSFGFFILEKTSDSYLIIDSNYHKSIGSFKYTIKYALYEYPLSLIGISSETDSESLPRSTQILIGLGITLIIIVIIILGGYYASKEFGKGGQK